MIETAILVALFFIGHYRVSREHMHRGLCLYTHIHRRLHLHLHLHMYMHSKDSRLDPRINGPGPPLIRPFDAIVRAAAFRWGPDRGRHDPFYEKTSSC